MTKIKIDILCKLSILVKGDRIRYFLYARAVLSAFQITACNSKFIDTGMSFGVFMNACYTTRSLEDNVVMCMTGIVY